jgi:hypothetical protein
MDTWEARMAARAKERTQRIENPAEFDQVFWRTQNVVLAADGTTILYPGDMPCSTCGLEIGDWPVLDHPLDAIPEDDELCKCGYHESYHRGHDCTKDNEGCPIACACSGGQPWTCCMNRHARQEQFLYQKLANVLLAATLK